MQRATDSRCRLCTQARRLTSGIRARASLRDPSGLRLERSEEHTSELQSLAYLVCRLLLEKKKNDFTVFRYQLGDGLAHGRGGLASVHRRFPCISCIGDLHDLFLINILVPEVAHRVPCLSA